MHIELTPDALLRQLDYPVNEKTLEQITIIINNMPDYKHLSKHILTLKDYITHYYGFIAMSNSKNYLKIKCEPDESEDNIRAFKKAVEDWSDKYKVKLEQVDNRPTYYIIGQL
ncbi:hypothetical protein MNB_SV-9-109 [hydrothermal vent metagenome]|uniref:Uncharacterized protein n=1 Tax=hydrothermal vent metagenome TaxID=652676 RepID=A0A1W1BRT6_9ZZZZ